MASADTAKLVASLSLDDKGFTRGIDRATTKAGTFDKTLGKIGSKAGAGLGTAAKNIAKIGAVLAGAGVGLLAVSIQQASDLNEQLNKTGAVFGKTGDAVVKFSETTAAALGISQAEALEAAGNFGNMFKTIGLADKQSAAFSTTLVTLAADMASFNNEDPNEMLDKLRSGLSGEAEPLRRFGVLLSEAAVAEEAYATGIAKRGKKLTEAQKVQARYSLILKQTKVQQGDFARTSGGLANQMRILRASFANTGATIGTALLPKITAIAVKINKLITDNVPAIKAFANQLPGAFDKALAFAERIPWGTIANGLKAAADWAGKLFDAFLKIPPEFQATIIALAGLNKLSGGAISGIVSELGKGLIKGVLGITAGVVNVIGKSVTGGGGVPVPGGGTPIPPGAGAAPGLGVLTSTPVVLGAVTVATLEVAAQQINVAGARALGIPQATAQQIGLAAGSAIPGPPFLAVFNRLGEVIGDLPGQIDKVLHPPPDPSKDRPIPEKIQPGRDRKGKPIPLSQAETESNTARAAQLAALGGISHNTKETAEAAAEAAAQAPKQTSAVDLVNQSITAAQQKAATDAAAALTAQQLSQGSIDSASAAASVAAAQDASKQDAIKQAEAATAAAIREKDLSVVVKNYTSVSTSVSVRELAYGVFKYASTNKTNSTGAVAS